jgi:hypothetical protein
LGVDAHFAEPGVMEKESKQFFFAKKNQETFIHLAFALPHLAHQRAKVFWFFFTKKNCFLPVLGPPPK